MKSRTKLEDQRQAGRFRKTAIARLVPTGRPNIDDETERQRAGVRSLTRAFTRSSREVAHPRGASDSPSSANMLELAQFYHVPPGKTWSRSAICGRNGIPSAAA